MKLSHGFFCLNFFQNLVCVSFILFWGSSGR
uniref:Uncharacterized protein n=1 Tax=Rhizophora mucronata TaxID=61149 RepID=A0A2P2JJ00_RHIMU